MTSSVTITAHPATANNGKPLKVRIIEHEDDYVVVRTTDLKNGEAYTCSVWEGRSVSVTEIPDD